MRMFNLNIDYLLTIIGVLIFIVILVLCSFVYINLLDSNDKNHEFTNITAYGIHELECPVCGAIGEDILVTGHDFITDWNVFQKETITFLKCNNCSHEWKIK